MHHTPAVVLSADKRDNTGLRRCWSQCCRIENISPNQAVVLPLLFAIDQQLGIADGFHYYPDCEALRNGGADAGVYCGGDFHDSSYDGGTDGLDSSSDSSSDSGSDSGCGGGCGGGD